MVKVVLQLREWRNVPELLFWKQEDSSDLVSQLDCKSRMGRDMSELLMLVDNIFRIEHK